jgi:hypothetical protein
VAPDFLKRNERKLNTPPKGNEPSEQSRNQPVETKLAAVKTTISTPPDTVKTVSAFRFRQHVLK